ncbi:Fet4p KNAG_0B03810 [Huiozyma naganishii CBS 8797]|uniref:Low-affinity Fe(2+) transport protein n=1 Tax=Huiozyma naganishii (strain ATCC MYA-139 / BCRC 22969 / CBS 8797 / KCTC 17520 / NBRC 10181 / NCYC 3082 / Yp74L-3) TaxID=1071383 RepID=J7RV88_HUIN7|nr:hypothetical protein KNAG_0B03810 [Kazachstania naganishii CBS 8797]CCK68822.1 hypothetical protein KNAG_0B03810 [Kazachstania naganishii CBS 8797]
MGRVGKFFGNPGKRPDLHHQAPLFSKGTDGDAASLCSVETAAVVGVPEKKDAADAVVDTTSLSDTSTAIELADVNLQRDGCIDVSIGFTGLHKTWFDKSLDWLVYWAGSQIVFIAMWAVLVCWVVVGAVYGAPFNWQVVMQDGQSIQCYVWDTLLMRQQLMSTHEQIMVCSQLRSRLASFKYFLLKDPQVGGSTLQHKGASADDEHSAGDLPIENWYDRVSSCASAVLGSVPAMVVYWIGIFVWIGCGALPQGGQKFADDWQMEINTAVAVSLLINSTFLQNIRARHDKFIAKCMLQIMDLDYNIDSCLRDHYPCERNRANKVITVHERKRTWGWKVIDWYADVIGTGIGVIIAIIAFGVWIGIGTPLHWDDNWWLIIGTYTGLVGFLDGFVIREVYYRIVQHEEENFAKLADEDLELFQQIGLECPEQYRETPKHKRTLNYRISSFVNRACSNQWSVLVSVLIIIALICIASGMKWSTTGQLIANTPTMIIEEFFLIVLLQAHNWADMQRRIELSSLLGRRRILLDYVSSRYTKN